MNKKQRSVPAIAPSNKAIVTAARALIGDNARPAAGTLRVWWIPQVPGKPFHVDVDSLAEGKKLMVTLAKYDQFQLDNRVKGDYCNTGGVEVWSDEVDPEKLLGVEGWIDWSDDDGYSVDELTDEQIAATDLARVKAARA